MRVRDQRRVGLEAREVPTKKEESRLAGFVIPAAFLLLCCAGAGCSDSNAPVESPAVACDSEPEILTTADGVEFVRTPDSCFESLPDFPYEVRFMEIDGLRLAYFDEGPGDADPVLLLHGQPSWSYLYRKMIPVFLEAGHRVIALDFLGLGRSDKPIDVEYYTYLGHIEHLKRFLAELDLSDITLFGQDWGSVIGLHVAGVQPERFARIVIGNGSLPTFPEGFSPLGEELVADPDVLDTEMTLADITGFAAWMRYALVAAEFRAGTMVQVGSVTPLSEGEVAAYDAPYPSRIYMAGPRIFPSLLQQVSGVNDEAWAGLQAFERPFLTLWGERDPLLGSEMMQARLVDNVAGAEGQPHDRFDDAGHFLQEDRGEDIARRMVELIANDR